MLGTMLRRLASSKVAGAMAALSLLVALTGLYALARAPAPPDMGGVIGRMFVLAAAAIQIVPLAGFTALALWLRSEPRGRWPLRLFYAWMAVSTPILAVGTYVGIGALIRWGLA
jgi:hypothetical protein